MNFMKIVCALVLSALFAGCATQQANNAAAGALIGGAIGAIAGDSRKAAVRGAVAGGILAGLLIPVVQGQNGQQVVYTGQQQSNCVQATVDGRPGCYDPNYLRTLQLQGQVNNGAIVTNLDPGRCPGGYRHNGQGWTCPGGQVGSFSGTQQGVSPTQGNCSNGLVMARVDGNVGCYSREYLATLNRN